MTIGSNSKDGRYEKILLCDNPLAIAMDGEATEVMYPYPGWDSQTWGRKEYWKDRDVKSAWLYDRIVGSRRTGNGNRAGVPLYDRSLLTIENIRHLLTDECLMCGVQLNYGRGYNKMHNEARGIIARPSIDRIDSDKGYEPDNVQILCVECNTEKG